MVCAHDLCGWNRPWLWGEGGPVQGSYANFLNYCLNPKPSPGDQCNQKRPWGMYGSVPGTHMSKRGPWGLAKSLEPMQTEEALTRGQCSSGPGIHLIRTGPCRGRGLFRPRVPVAEGSLWCEVSSSGPQQAYWGLSRLGRPWPCSLYIFQSPKSPSLSPLVPLL